ncbi:MAG: Gfo/Idh/MocA family protein [Acidimicrobiales bacterium]
MNTAGAAPGPSDAAMLRGTGTSATPGGLPLDDGSHLPLSWGVIGATSYVATRAVLPAIAASPTCRLAAVASRDPTSAWEAATRFGADRHYDTYEGVLEDPAVEAVYIPLPNSLHHAWTLRAAAAGKHVLCEKPLATDAATAADMARACDAAGVVLMEAYMTQFHPRAAALDRWIDKDGLGDFRSGHASFTFRLSDPGNHRWRPEMGGGALSDVGVYCLAPLLVAARRPPVAVAATAVMAPSGVDASFTGWLDFGEGRAASVAVSFEAPETQTLSLLGTVAGVTVDGAFAAGAGGSRLSICPAGTVRAPAGADADPYRGMVEHFADVVRGRARLRRGPEQSVVLLEVVDRLRAAAMVA